MNDYDDIPDELKTIPRWVNFRVEQRDNGTTTKPPICSKTLKYARKNQAEDFSDFSLSSSVVKDGQADGLGFVFPDGYLVFDVDDAIDEHGEISPVAAKLIDEVDSYTEFSPSGTGFRIIAKGQAPFDEENKKVAPDGLKELRLYRQGYLTITGDVYGELKPIRDLNGQMASIYAQYFSKPDTPTPTVKKIPRAFSVDDRELLDKARGAKNGETFSALFDSGDISSYPSASEADAALAGILNFWTGNDAHRTESLMWDSALVRDKWSKHPSYLQRTIENASASDTYSPPRERQKEPQTQEEGITFPSYFGEGAKTVKAPDFLVGEPFNIPVGFTTFIAGFGGAGKSTLASAIGADIALGLPTLADAPTMRKKVAYLDFEAGEELNIPKMEKTLAGKGLTRSDLGGWYDYFPYVDLHLPIDVAVKDAIERLKLGGYEVVILDSFEGMFGAIHMHPEKVSEAIKNHIEPFRDAGMTPIVIDHSPKPQKGEYVNTVIGTVSKLNYGRSVHTLIPMEGNVLQWDTIKTNVGRPRTVYLKVDWNEELGYIRYSETERPTDLDGMSATDAVREAVIAELEADKTKWFSRSELIENVAAMLGKSSVTIRDHMGGVLVALEREGVIVRQPDLDPDGSKKRGNPQIYKLKSITDIL